MTNGIRWLGRLFFPDRLVLSAAALAVVGAIAAAHIAWLSGARPWIPAWLLGVTAAGFCAAVLRAKT
jgi:hypothetical protein